VRAGAATADDVDGAPGVPAAVGDAAGVGGLAD
jgi:hypothetical protein